MRRFFIDIPDLDQEKIALPSNESKHVIKVLRMKLGDKIEVINGAGALFKGEIIVDDTRKIILQKLDLSNHTKEKYHIHIAIAPTKQNDRFEWFLEKATELGIHEITPLLCHNSERKKINIDRYNRILVAAIKQSKRLFLPQLHLLTNVNEFIVKNPNGLLAHCYEDSAKNSTIFKSLEKNPTFCTSQNTPILIGPEGDFSLEEVQLAKKNNFQAITLGKTRLRTETAGLYACANVKLFFEEYA